LSAKVPGNESSRERKFPVNGPGSKMAKKRKFQGVNWPGSYWPIRSNERIGPGAKMLRIRDAQIYIRG